MITGMEKRIVISEEAEEEEETKERRLSLLVAQ